MHFVFCRLCPSPLSQHGSVWVLTLTSLLLKTNNVSRGRACLSIWVTRFRGTQNEDDRGPVSIQSSLWVTIERKPVEFAFPLDFVHTVHNLSISRQRRNHYSYLDKKTHIFIPIRKWRQFIDNKLDGFFPKNFFWYNMIKQVLHWKVLLWKIFFAISDKQVPFNIKHIALQRKSYLCFLFLGIARPQSQFPHSYVCERFIYFPGSAHIFPAAG